MFASGVARLLLLAPVGVGAIAHADEGGDEDGKSSKGSSECVVHVFLLFAPESRCVARAARGSRFFRELAVLNFSVGGFEILTQPSLSLAYFEVLAWRACPCLAALPIPFT